MVKKKKLIPAIAVRKARRALRGTDHLPVIVATDFLQDKSDKCLEALAKFRTKIEQMTWLQVRSSKGLNLETRKPPPKDWPPQVSPDEPCIRLKSDRKGRIWGFRDDQIYQVVWIDTDHRLDG